MIVLKTGSRKGFIIHVPAKGPQSLNYCLLALLQVGFGRWAGHRATAVATTHKQRGVK